MKPRSVVFGPVLTAVVGALLLTGCNDFGKFKDRLKLNDAQALRAKPIVEEYLQKQDSLLDEMKSRQPSQGPGGPGGMGGPGGSGGGSDFSNGGPGGTQNSGRPDMSAMKKAMDQKREEMEKKFLENDEWAIKELSAFLSEQQLSEFKIIAEEVRKEKMQEIMNANKGNGPGGGKGPGGPGGFGGPGGMGGPGF